MKQEISLNLFIKNPYSLDNIKRLSVYLRRAGRKALSSEVETFLSLTSDEFTIRSYVNIAYESFSVTKSSFKYYLKDSNLDNIDIIFEQAELIDEYLIDGIIDFDKSYLYPFHSAIVNGNMNIFIDSLKKYPELLDNHILTLELRLYIDYLYSLNNSSISLFKILCKYNYNKRFNSEIKLLYEKLNKANRTKCLPLLPEGLEDDIDIDTLINNLHKVDKQMVYKKIDSAFNSICEPERIKIFMKLLKKVDENSEKEFYNNLLKLRDRLPICPLLDLYIKNLFKFEAAYYRKYDNEIISLENYFLFFDIKASSEVEISFGEPEIVRSYSLFDINGSKLISFYLDDDVPRNYDYLNKVDKYGEDSALNTIIDYADNSLYEFKQEYEKCVDKVLEISNLKNDRILLDAFSKIEDNSLAEISGSLSGDMKVGVDYHFYNDFDNKFKLALRIGNFKSYSVSNPSKFLSAFRFGEKIKYGKDLTFYHKMDNINEKDREAIAYLASLNPMNKQKYLILDSSSVIHLFNTLKNRVVSFEEKPYTLRLDVVEAKYKLDSNYNLSFNIDYSKIMQCFNKYLAFDDNNHLIDYIDNKNSALTNFIINYGDKSLQRVKKEFGERIFPLYADSILIDDNIKGEFKTSELEINAYFDFNMNSDITLRTSYNKNGAFIKEEAIIVNADIIKKNKYKEAILSFGFNDSDILENDNDIISFLKADLTNLKKIANVYLTDAILDKKLIKFTPPTLQMSFNNDMLSVFMKESVYSDEELYQILQALKKKRKFVLLKGDRIVDLDNKESDSFLDMVNDLDLDQKNLTKEEEKPLYQTLLAFKHLDYIELDSYLIKLVEDIKTFKEKKYKLPKVNANLRDYQIEGFNWLKILSEYHLGGILADDMGLGKTLEIITLLSSDNSNLPSLIVTPKSLIFNWISEFNRFAPDYEIIPIYGLQGKREELIKEINYKKRVAYITSYDSLRNDLKKYKKEFNYLILDEAQYIKNALALTTKAVKGIKSINRFALTGTPIENDIFDLWSIFDFLMPSYLPSMAKFKAHGGNSDFQDMIKKRVAPFILRRTKEAVLTELPEKFERVISADMTIEQKKLYDAHCYNAREVLNNGGQSFDVIHLLTRLRQICVDPRTFVEGYEEKSGKILLLRELIPNYIKEGHRILIFSQFVKALNLVEEELYDLNIKYLKITGDTDSKDRLKYVDEFNKNEEYSVFLISLKAGGNGLNLVGADTVIHLDPWWNLASENQATDRAYRMGQTKNVEVIRLIVADSIEQRVVELQYKKKDLIDKLISNDTKAIEKISIDDMKFILE